MAITMTRDLVKSDKVLKLGQRMEFTLMDVADKSHSSRLEDIQGDKLMVAMPFDERRVPILPEVGSQIFGKIITKSCAYRFTSTFHTAVAKPIPMWVISKPVVVEKFQNREFVRVKVTRPIIVHPINEEGVTQPLVSTNTVDISGGGVCFVLFNPLPLNSQVTMDIDNLSNMELLQIKGEVVRCQPVDVAGIKVYHIGVKFLDMPRIEQSKLIKFIFELQRRNLKMGV